MASHKPTAELAAAIKAAEEKYGDLPKGLLEKLASVESAGGRNLVNPKSSARGPFQFMEYTGPEFGLKTEADRMDITKSTDAAARLTIRNKKVLEAKLGRPVTGGELYLAHQQGADGALKLLANPNALARDVVGGKDPASKIRLNGGDPDKTTAGAFATKWTSAIDGVATAPTAPTAPKPGASPGKKPEPRATGSLGVLPGSSGPLPGLSKPSDFYTYDPNNLAELNRRVANTGAVARAGANAPSLVDQMMTDAPVARGSLATNLGKLGAVANAPTSAPAEVPASRKSTAILAGLNTVDKVMRSQAAIDSTIESSLSEYEYAPSGLGGEFSAGIDAGMANINKDREYFGLILDTLTGNKAGVWSHEKNAEIAKAAAAFAMSGMPSFEDWIKAPTLDGFLTQAAIATGQVAPSAIESIASALVGGGAGLLGKLGMSASSKTVAKEVVKDILKKKVGGEVIDKAEDDILKGLWAAGKKGAIAGAFGQEFIMGSGESISEFKEVDKDIDVGEALFALGMGVPQAAVGVGSEMFLVKAFGEAALKKSTRIAGDNVFKRFAADMGMLMGKSGLGEGVSEGIQEGLFIAQRKAIDPTYTDEEAQLRMAQSIFTGFVGGGLFAGGAAAPTAAISALNRKTLPNPNDVAGTPSPDNTPPGGTPPPAGTPPKKSLMDGLKGVMKKATSYIEDASAARVEAEAKQNVEGVDDSVLTGNTAPEGTVVLAQQYKEMLDPASPRKHVWIAENDFDTTLDTFQQERLKREGYFVEEQTDPANKGKKLEYTFVPGKGVMVGEVKGTDTATPGVVLRNLVQSKAPDARLNKLIGAMLGMADTGGVKGDTVVRAKNKQGVPIAEQTTTPEGVPEAAAAMQAQAPNAEIEVVPVEQSLEERKQRVDAEQTAADFFARFAEEEAPPAAAPAVTPAEKKGLNEALAALPEEDVQKQMEEEDAALQAATDPMSDDPKVIENLADDFGFGDYTDPNFEVYADSPGDGPVGSMTDAELSMADESLADGLALERRSKKPDSEAIFSIRHAMRAVAHEQAKRAKKDPDVKYSRGKMGAGTVKQTRAAAEQSFAGVKHLFKSGALRVEDKPSRGIDPEAQAVTDEDGIVTVYAANTSPDHVRGLLLHELGAHVGMRKIMGEQEFNRLLGDIYYRTFGGRSGGSIPKNAKLHPDVRARIAERTDADPEFRKPDELLATIYEGLSAEDKLSPHMLEDVLGQFLEQAPEEHSLIKRIITRAKVWLRRNAPQLFKSGAELTNAEILEFAKAAVRAEIKEAKKATAPKAKTLREKIIGKGNPDAEGFITSAEKALADPAPRFKTVKRLTADQWRKFFREAGATKEAFKYQIEPALESITPDAKGDITRVQIEEGLYTNRITMKGQVDRNEKGYSSHVADGKFTNYAQRVFSVTKAAMRRYLGDKAFQSHNWDVVNPVVHIRTTDRVTTKGEAVKFGEEWQSDDHQEGAAQGYKEKDDADDPKGEQLDRAQQAAGVRLAEFLRGVGVTNDDNIDRILYAYRPSNGYKGPEATVDGIQLTDAQYKTYVALDRVYYDAFQALENYAEALYEEQETGVETGPVARLPMEAWEGPAIERILLEAVKSGIDLVAFTNSKTLPFSLNHKGTRAFYDYRSPRTLARIAARLGIKIETVEIHTTGIAAFATQARKSILAERVIGSDGKRTERWTSAYYLNDNGGSITSDDMNIVDGDFATEAEAKAAAVAEIDSIEAKAAKLPGTPVQAVRLTEQAKRMLRDGVVMYSRPDSETRDMKIDPKNKNPGKTAGYTAPKSIERKNAAGLVRKIPVESKGGKVKGEATTATPYPVVREEGDSTESFQKMEPTGAPDSNGEVDIDPEDQNREPTLQDKIELRFGREADNAEVVSKEFAKKEFPVEISERGPTALKAIKELFKLIIQDISIASLKEQLPYMMDSMLINLLKLVKQDQESIFTIEDAAGGMLQIVKRDDTVTENITIEKRAVRAAVAMVKGPSWNRQSGMTWFLNSKGEMEQTGTSYFWLYDQAEDKSYRLIGNRPKVEDGFGRPGIMALAQAGVKLNVNTKSGLPQGEIPTEKQKLRLGLQSMIAALSSSGYQIRVGADPQFALPFKSVEEIEDGRALFEVVALVNGGPVVIGELLSGALPFDTTSDGPKVPTSGADLTRSGGTEKVTRVETTPEMISRGDPVIVPRQSEGLQQLDKGGNIDWNKSVPGGKTVVNPVVPGEQIAGQDVQNINRPEQTGRMLATQTTRVQGAPDPDIDPEVFALNEDRRKDFAGVRLEAREYLEKFAMRNVRMNQAFGKALKKAIRNDTTFEYLHLLPEIPSDVTFMMRKFNNEFVVTIASPRYKDIKVEAPTEELAIALAHKAATQQPGQAANRYDRLLLEASDNATMKGQAKYDENTGVGTPRNQTSVRDMPLSKIDTHADIVETMGDFGHMSTRLIGIASGLFNIHRPTTIMTLRHLKDNFNALVGPGGKFANNADKLLKAVLDLDSETVNARVIMGDQNIIIVRSETRTRYDKKGNAVFAPDDAVIASTIAHEIGHILFRQEYEAIRNDQSAKRVLWLAYRERVAKFGANLPTQYTEDTAGFEEWYADQVMTFVYNEGQKAKNGADMYFKRMADSFRDFFRRVTAALGFRLWESRLKAGNVFAQEWRVANKVLSDDPKTPNAIKEGQWTFAEYMNEVIKSHAVQRKLNNELPVVTEVIVRDMALNIAGRLPVNAARNVANSARRLLTTGSFGNVAYKLHNILWASTDFMGNAAHGRGGQVLKNFFGTLSQKVVASGWNKNKIFAENRFNTELARILGITRKSGADDWKSQRVTDILNEAADNSIPTPQLSTQEAKDIRAFFKKIMDEYITDPSTGIQWVDVGNLPNFGGSRMYNVEKIAADIDAFVDWVVARPEWNGTRDMAMAMARRITSHTGDPRVNLAAEVDHDILNGVIPSGPVSRAAEMLFRSMEQHAVTPIREDVIKGAKDGAYTFSDLLQTLQAKYPAAASNPSDASLAFIHGLNTAAPDAQLESDIREFWRQRTERMRLSPGMDPALERSVGLDRIGTKAFREAIPGDPDGWLIPQAKANSQYIHYVTRKVEYNKMGGYEYVASALNSIPREHRQQVDDAVMANLGKFGENISPAWRTFNSVAAVWTVYTTLLFAALTSITDLSGILVRSKEFDNMGSWFAAMKEAVSNDEWKTFAEDIGVVTMRSQDHAMIGHGELDYANNTSRALMNGFFRATGLEFFTRFSRTMAVGMGRQFLVRTAERADFDPVKHGRWLAELGLTREDVQQWVASGHNMSTPAGLKVRDAIARFADEAVIRPDASQRPTFASSPYFQAIWQLKSYYYGFGKTVLGGMGREMKNRYNETGSISEAAGPALMLAVTIIPLTMLGLSSREWLKWLFQLAIPGVEETPSMTSQMDGGEYTWEIFKRSGVLGPFSLGLTTMEAFKWEGIAAPLTANIPMFDLFDDTLFDGDWTRPLPVINNIK